MGRKHVNVDRDTPMLLPVDLREWVATDDLAHFLVDAVGLLDLSAARVNERGTGSAQYPPGMLLAVVVYCYAQGMFSSRQIERATYQHLSVRYLAGDTHPDHDTIAKFRRENGPLLRSAFVQLLRLAQAAGLCRLGAIALDGTKLAAAAAKRKTLTAAQLQQQIGILDQRVAQLLAAAEAADQRPEATDRLPAELADAQQRRARLQAAQAELERQGQVRRKEQEDQPQNRPPGQRPRRKATVNTINPTDPDSTLTPTAQTRYIQGYNGQVAVAAEGGLIVAADVVRDTSDIQQLEPMARQVVANVGAADLLLVDTGYANMAQVERVEQDCGLTVLCPPARNAQAKAGSAPSSPWRRRRKQWVERLRQRLQTPAGKELYALRGTTVEPAIGIIKSVLGFRRFSLRGLAKVRTEWTLVSLAFNCRRLAARWN